MNQMPRRRRDPQTQIQNQILNQLRLADYYHLMFLKPFECVLKQSKDGLSKGLKIVNRTDNLKFAVQEMWPILSYQKFNQLSNSQKKELQEKHQKEDKKPRNYSTYRKYCEQNNADNLLSQLKVNGLMEIAICICMYNEDQEMLNNTLMGIGENIASLYKKGVDPDKIVVIIVQDGIEKMDKSIQEFIQILQAESNIKFHLKKEKKFQQALSQIGTVNANREKYSWDGEEALIDLNCFLFEASEEEKRRDIRFVKVKKEYDEIKKEMNKIKQLQNDKTVTHEDLPPRVLQNFKKECKKNIFGDAAMMHEDTEATLNDAFNQVAVDIQKSRPLVQNALSKSLEQCKQYIESRQKMSHVSFFRTAQFFPDNSGFSTTEFEDEKISKMNQILRLTSEREEEKKMLKSEFEQKHSIKMNIFFVVKYRNSQKLSSHNWFFNGFCKQFQNNQENQTEHSPKYTILLDVGLRPEKKGLCKMYYAMKNHPDKIGGVCGYMGLKQEKVDKESQKTEEELDLLTKMCMKVVNIQRAQQIEYHFAHLIDKGFQSLFGFIHVLPGAFSGYNMKAIWGRNQNEQLLKAYFKSIKDKVNDQDFKDVQLSFGNILARILLPNLILKRCVLPDDRLIKTYEQLMYESNVYLAEDRVLCIEIHKKGFDLIYLPDAYSLVDPVKDLPSLLGQRKRWINGSYFAFQKVSDQFSEMSFKCVNFQIWYLSLMNIMAYVAPGFFLFSISVAMQAFKADVLSKFFQDIVNVQSSRVSDAFVYTINFIYAMLLFGLTYKSMSLTNRNEKFVKFVYGVSTIFGLMSIIILAILVTDLIRGLNGSQSYLIDNRSLEFVQNIPGGLNTVNIIRYIVLGIVGMYSLPLVIYTGFFCSCKALFQVILGAISFAFYTPTYLIILNIYALCRMDDLSWGTKGLEASSGDKDGAVLNCWKIIKIIHVGKMLFWNCIVAGLLIHFGSNYLIRFYMTLGLIAIIALTMAIKVLCSILYYCYYKIGIKSKSLQTSMPNTRTTREQLYAQSQPSRPINQPSLLKSLTKKSGRISLIEELELQICQNIKNLRPEPVQIRQQQMNAWQQQTNAQPSPSMLGLGITSLLKKLSLTESNVNQKDLKKSVSNILEPKKRNENYKRKISRD